MIKYKQLSKPLKTAVITGWIALTTWIIYFLIGFIQGLLTGLA